MHLLGVFDGHRGDEASDFVSRQFIPHLIDAWSTCKSPEEALSKTFVSVDGHFVKQTGGKSKDGRRCPGCTGNAVLIWRDTICIANAGDCR